MGWIVFAVLVIVDFLTVFIILTDGRYFGPRLARWRNLVDTLQLRKVRWPEGDVFQQARENS